MVDVLLQKRLDGNAAKRFSKRLLRKHKGEPRKIVSDKLRSYGVAHRELIPETIHQAQRFSCAHAAVYNLSNLGRHLVSAENYRYFKLHAFAS